MLIRAKSNVHEELPDGRTLPYVSAGRLYVVMTISPENLRIVEDFGEPVLVPRSRFDIVDEWIPEEWPIFRCDEWYQQLPLACAPKGFFERWHDGRWQERQIFAEEYKRMWRHYEAMLGDQTIVLKCL